MTLYRDYSRDSSYELLTELQAERAYQRTLERAHADSSAVAACEARQRELLGVLNARGVADD
jgi:hypothetical protein